MNRYFAAAALFVILIAAPDCFAFQQASTSRSADSLLNAGIRNYAEARYDDAIRILSDLPPDSMSAQALFYLGMSYAATNDFQSANVILSRAVAADSMNNSYRFQYAKFLILFGSADEAQRQYERIIQSDTTFYPAYFQLGVLINGQRNNPTREKELFTHLVRHQPRDFLSYHFLGDVLIRLGSPDEGRAMIATSISLNPNHVPAITQLAGIYYGKNLYEEARRLYENASRLRPNDATIMFNAGECLRKMRLDSAAVEFYRRAFTQDTSNARYAAQFGYAYYLRKSYDSSASMYKKAIKLDDENPQFWLNLALVYHRMDSLRATVDAYLGAVQASKPDQIGDIYYQLGTFYNSNAKYKEALAAYNKAVMYSPTHELAHFYLGSIYDRQANGAGALRHYENYLSFTKGDTTVNRSREFIIKRVEDLKKKTK